MVQKDRTTANGSAFAQVQPNCEVTDEELRRDKLQTNADKEKTAKGHEWTRIKIEREHVHRLEGSRFIR
jgi:hypothetical protein